MIEKNTKIIDLISAYTDYVFALYFANKEQATSLGDCCEIILGGTPSREKNEYWNGNIPWINSGKLNNSFILKATENITELGLAKSASKLMPKNTMAIAITGATLGQLATLKIECCANQSVIGIIPNETIPYEYKCQ